MIRRIVLLVLAVAFLATATAASAHADAVDDEIGLSADGGTTWIRELVQPLFGDGFHFSPGDSETTSFLVRNDGPTGGLLTVDVTTADPNGLLASGDLLVEAQVADGPWTTLGLGTTVPGPVELEVPVGTEVPVSLRATLDPASTREDELVPVSFVVTMEEDGSVGGVDDGDGGDGGDTPGEVGGVGGGILPETGSPFGIGLMWLAAALVGTGLALVRAQRRDDREEVARHG